MQLQKHCLSSGPLSAKDRTWSNAPPFSILPSMYQLYIESILQFPNIVVVELLLECGANVNAVDNENQHRFAPMFGSYSESRNGTRLMKRIAELLLKYEAHVDMVNIVGDRAVDSLLSSLMVMNMLDFVNLRCLAARVVMKYKIPHVGHIPASLDSFVQMHGTYNPGTQELRTRNTWMIEITGRRVGDRPMRHTRRCCDLDFHWNHI